MNTKTTSPVTAVNQRGGAQPLQSSQQAEPALEEVLERTAEQQMHRAGDVAAACKEIVLSATVQIGSSKHVRIEGWQAIAVASGCSTGSEKVRRVYDTDGKLIGYEADGWVKDQRGRIVASGVGFVGFDEKDRKGNPTWKLRPEYAGRAMAQTRAISRACRGQFAHVVVMMRAGLSTATAEEAGEEAAEEPAEDDVTDGQLKLLTSLYREADYTRGNLEADYGISNSRDLTRRQAARLIEHLQGKLAGRAVDAEDAAERAAVQAEGQAS